MLFEGETSKLGAAEPSLLSKTLAARWRFWQDPAKNAAHSSYEVTRNTLQGSRPVPLGTPQQKSGDLFDLR